MFKQIWQFTINGESTINLIFVKEYTALRSTRARDWEWSHCYHLYQKQRFCCVTWSISSGKPLFPPDSDRFAKKCWSNSVSMRAKSVERSNWEEGLSGLMVGITAWTVKVSVKREIAKTGAASWRPFVDTELSFNDCLLTSYFSCSWKIERWVTILKTHNQDSADIKSLRPVTLLLELGEVFERTIRQNKMLFHASEPALQKSVWVCQARNTVSDSSRP